MTEDNRHPLKSLLVTQFFGAFNDNAWKLIVTFLAIRALQSSFVGSEAEFQAASQFQTTLAFCVLTLPLMLFSLPAGLLADRVSKRSVIISMKFFEVVLMFLAGLSLFLAPDELWMPLIILGLMGAQSALFSPAKYGILPEIVPHAELSYGNGLLQMWTFLAIILGTAAGGPLLDRSGSQIWIVGLFLLVTAVIGFIASFGIPKVPAARAEGALVETIRSAWSAIRAERILGLAVAGSVVYWTIGSLLLQDILVYSKTVLDLSDTVSAFPLAVSGLGIGVGSVAAGKLSRSKVEYGLIPLGATLMAAACFLLALLSPQLPGLLILMALLGLGSGLLLVPLTALIQWLSPSDRRGAVIALSNIFVFTGIFLASISATLLASLGFSPQSILLVASLAVATATIWAIWLLPDALLRLVLILATHSVYRLKIIGQDHVPAEGGVLLVPNHVSFVDALMLIASLDRPIRFLVDQTYFDRWLFRPFIKSLGAIPISSSGGPRVILRALRDAGQYLDEGEVVCIFPEGQITRTGTLLPFERGLERIAKNREAAIVPVYLDRLWGSIFSHESGRFLSKIPREFPYSVTVAFGEALDAGTTVPEIRQAVQELASTAWCHRKEERRPLHRSFVGRARRRPFALAFADAGKPRVSRFKALVGAVTLARTLKPHWSQQTRVGILLPPTVAGALVNLAASLSGRTSVNLNYTVGKSVMESAIRQAALESIVTSRTFQEKLNLEMPEGIDLIWMEDLAAGIGFLSKVSSGIASYLLPQRMLEKLCGASRRSGPDDVATVIFSSGSTGEPKGIMLTHANIDSNVEGIAQVLRATSQDRVLGILPLFHSFGYMCFWFAAQKGLAMPMQPNPLDAPAVGDFIHRYRVTILLATPTFLQLYMRGCTPAQLGSLRLVLTGAEKLSERLALAFEEQFGIRPLEGYGSTECSPVIAVSVPDFRAPGFFQPGSRRGFVGQPLPGVAVRIVDPDTFEPLSADSQGMLIVRGPNVMKGYLGRDDLSRSVLREGWYVTGDIALVNEDGFLKITDRLSRFSKIGGEMVPHGKVEEALHQAAEVEHQVFSVTAVADDRKGECLAVIHIHEEETIPEILKKLSEMGLPNLFIPRRDKFLKVDELPLLGSGKINLKEAKRIATEHFQ